MSRRPLLLLLPVLVALLPGCLALSCYKCSDLTPNTQSEVNHPLSKTVTPQRCSDFDPDNSTFVADPCVPPYDKSCVKLVSGSGKVIRGCYDLPLDNCTVGADLTSCYCTSDLCNSAGSTAPALLLLLPAALLAALSARR